MKQYSRLVLPEEFAGFILIIIFFFVPLFEAPKNIFLLLFFSICLLHISKDFNFEKLDVIWIFWCLTTITSGILADYFIDSIQRNFGWLRYTLFLYFVYKISFSMSIHLNFHRTVAFSLIISILESLIMPFVQYPELRSVGHVNQSALYCSFASISIFYLFVKGKNFLDIVLGLLAVSSAIYFLLLSQSIVAISLFFLIGGCFCTYNFFTRGHFFPLFSLLIFILILIFVDFFVFKTFNHFYLEVYVRFFESGDPLSSRGKIFLAVSEVFDIHPWFGWGISKFGTAVSELVVKSEVIGEFNLNDWDFFKQRFEFANHGHSFYLTVLIERGFVGLAAFIAVILFAGCRIWKSMIANPTVELFCGLVSLFACALGGFVQTTFHVEHGLLSLAYTGLALNVTNRGERY